jgi:hypothetical protein
MTTPEIKLTRIAHGIKDVVQTAEAKVFNTAAMAAVVYFEPRAHSTLQESAMSLGTWRVLTGVVGGSIALMIPIPEIRVSQNPRVNRLATDVVKFGGGFILGGLGGQILWDYDQRGYLREISHTLYQAVQQAHKMGTRRSQA